MKKELAGLAIPLGEGGREGRREGGNEEERSRGGKERKQ